MPAVGSEKVLEIKNERQKSGRCTNTVRGDTGARRRLLPRAAGRGETLPKVPDRERETWALNWADCSRRHGTERR